MEYLKRGYMRALLEAGDLQAIEKMKQDLQQFEAAQPARSPATKNNVAPTSGRAKGAGGRQP